MSIGDSQFHFSPSGLPDAKDLRLSVELMLKDWRIVTGVDVPYCAGCSEDGKTIYIDKNVPQFWTPASHPSKSLDIWHGPLFVHESFEKTILEKYGNEHYPGAHTFATFWENAFTQAMGFDVQQYENEFWAPLIKKIGSRKEYKRVPADLDLTPYRDEGDTQTLERMTFVHLSKDTK